MSNTTFIQHRSKQILRMDFANLHDTAETLGHIAEAKAIVAQQPKASLLVLLVVSGSTFNKEVVAAIRDLAEHDRPFVIASAIVGVEGLQALILKTVSRVTRRSFKLFSDEDAAMDWLIAQR
jgi:predicted dinucleotide-utilizing enzyme